MISKNLILQEIWRYPIKGFNGEKLIKTSLKKNRIIEGDREFAISIGKENSEKPKNTFWQPKRNYIQLLNSNEITKYNVRIDKKTNFLKVSNKGKVILNVSIEEIKNCSNKFFKFLPQRYKYLPKLVSLKKNGFTDNSQPFISIGGSGSIENLSIKSGLDLETQRFRLNLIIKTSKPFEEFNWVGKNISVGSAVIKIVERVGRCSAINIQPKTANKPLDLLPIMRSKYGHTDLGIFGLVIKNGIVNIGDEIKFDYI